MPDSEIMTHIPITVGAASTAVLPANGNRKYLLLENISGENIDFKFGEAAVLNEGIRLYAYGGKYELSRKRAGETGYMNPGAINAICVSGGMTLLVTEGT
ncbi:MAG: hypothetical protein A2Y91_03480 [Chloroflexi bacterium RBG_13_54_8]|nr:MAG: hypothetical protein A2Y91_03480 [Chloroflexi bacterium RBG_13_54_8]